MIASCYYVAQLCSVVFIISSHSQLVLWDIFGWHVTSQDFDVEAPSPLASIHEDDEINLFQPSVADCGRLSVFSQSELNDLVRDLYLPHSLLNFWLSDCKRKHCWNLALEFQFIVTEKQHCERTSIQMVKSLWLWCWRASSHNGTTGIRFMLIETFYW